MQGFLVFDYLSEYPAARVELARWLGEGKIQGKETIVRGGLKMAEDSLLQLFRGTNIGRFVGLHPLEFPPLIGWSVGKLLVEVKSPGEPSKL